MKLTSTRILAAVLIVAQSGAVQAADDAFQMFEEEAKVVTVASANRPESVVNSVSNVTVIDRQAIEKNNFSSVAEALQTVPGVMVWRRPR